MRWLLLFLFAGPGLSLVAHEGEPELPFDYPHAHDNLTLHLHSGWENRYFSEGRDNLDGDSLWASSIEGGWSHLSSGIWYAESPDQDYDELQMTLGLSGAWKNLEAYLAGTRIEFPHSGDSDEELGAGILWTGLPGGLELSLDAYHSFEADGSFCELALARELASHDRLVLTGLGVVGLNFGYVADGHDGFNHLSLHLILDYGITEFLSLTANCAYSWAIGRDANYTGDQLLKDLFHFGIGLAFSH